MGGGGSAVLKATVECGVPAREKKVTSLFCGSQEKCQVLKDNLLQRPLPLCERGFLSRQENLSPHFF